MKNLFALSLVLFLCFSCSPKTESTEADKSTQPTITKVDASIYKAAIDKSMESTPIERLCNESKGYNSNQWEGLNQCGWAVEKFRIEQNKDLVQRIGDTLFLQLKGKKLELRHKAAPEFIPSTYYQYKGFLKKANAYYLEVNTRGKCPQFWIINADDGEKTVISGRPVFNGQQDAFVLSAVSRKANDCKGDLQYWLLKKNKFIRSWTFQPENSLYDIVWGEGKTWHGIKGVNGKGELSCLQISCN